MPIYIQHNGAVSDKKPCQPLNQEGCSRFVDDTDTPTQNYFVPFDTNGNPVLTEGDTFDSLVWYSNNQPLTNGINNSESSLDFTNNGTNTSIPLTLNEWNYGDNNTEEGERMFYELIKDSNDRVIGIKNFIIYNKDITLSDDCKTKVENYVNWEGTSGS
jgi:hypothetical protein